MALTPPSYKTFGPGRGRPQDTSFFSLPPPPPLSKRLLSWPPPRAIRKAAFQSSPPLRRRTLPGGVTLQGPFSGTFPPHGPFFFSGGDILPLLKATAGFRRRFVLALFFKYKGGGLFLGQFQPDPLGGGFLAPPFFQGQAGPFSPV